MDSKWKAEYHHYAGSNKCFVYKFHFETNEYSIFEYHHSGDKPYFVQSDYNGITIGLENVQQFIFKMIYCWEGPQCDTFKNDPLSSNPIFQIKNLEIWCPFFE